MTQNIRVDYAYTIPFNFVYLLYARYLQFILKCLPVINHYQEQKLFSASESVDLDLILVCGDGRYPKGVGM